MRNLKYLTITSGITLIAGLVPLFLLRSPAAVIINKVAIAVSIFGLATTMTLYFWQEATTALTFREEDSRWH